MHKFLLFALITAAGILGAAPLSLTETEHAITVKAEGTDYTIHKKPFPDWGQSTVLNVGRREDKCGLSQMAVLLDAGQLLINGTTGKAQFNVLENTQDIIRIKAVFPLSPRTKADVISDAAQQIFYFTFANGAPGAVVESRIKCLTEKIRVNLFSCNFGANFHSYSDRNGKETKYEKGDWASIGFKEVYASKPSGRYFFYPAIGRTPSKGVTTHVAAKWTEKTLEQNETLSMKVTIGKVASLEDGEKILSFFNSTNNPPEDNPGNTQSGGIAGMNAWPISKPIKIGAFDGWDGIPLTVERFKASDYRPAEANTWQGPHDLSFKAWAAFDKDYFYLRINVRDDQFIQKESGTSIWAGDCIQIGIDPLCEKSLSENQLLLGFSPTDTPTVCAWSHPNPEYLKNDLLSVVKCASRRDKGGYECELAFPWDFIKPFELVRGKFGFNIVVLDGANRWMGITDGIAGGKVPGLYQDLYFKGLEDSLFAAQKTPKPELLLNSSIISMDKNVKFNAFVYARDADLPAELTVDFPGDASIRKPLQKGFNSFSCIFLPSELKRGPGKASVALLAGGKRLYEQKYDVVLTDKKYILEHAAELTAKAEQLDALARKIQTDLKKTPAYIISRAAIAKYFASRSVMLATFNANSPKKEALYFSTLSRSMKNLLYCDNMIAEGIAEAQEVLAGKRQVLEVPVVPKGARPTPTKDGGFAIGEQEYLFMGGNTWSLAQEDVLDYIAKSGLNFFNLFNVGKTPEAWKKMIRHAEDLGLFFNRRICMDPRNAKGYYCVNELQNAKFVTIDQQSTAVTGNTGTPWDISPNLLYVVGHEETIHPPFVQSSAKISDEEKNAIYQQRLTKFLKDKFGSVQALNSKTGKNFASFEEAAAFGKGLECSSLKYEHFLCFEPEVQEKIAACVKELKRLYGVPVSTHLSSLNFKVYDTLAILGDYDAHWNNFDLPSFDAGTGPEHREFAMNCSGLGVILTDMARSFYPERPCVNNEEYIMTCSNPNATPPEQYHYTGTIHPALHGRTAGSIFSFDSQFTSRFGELTFRRAEGFFQTARATLDMRRLANHIAPFRNLKGPAAILYTMPSYLDGEYGQYMITAWEGMNFSGLPVKFISERQIKAGKLNDFAILAVPNAKYVTNDIFNAIKAFAGKGGTVLYHGDKAMKFNEQGVAEPGRAQTISSFTKVPSDTAKAWFNAYEKTLAEKGIQPQIQVTDAAQKHIYGLEYRASVDRSGKETLYLVNTSKAPVIANIHGRSKWFDLLSLKEVNSPVTLNSLDVLILK